VHPHIFTCEVACPRLDAHTPARGSPHTRPVHVNMSNAFAWYCMHISMHVCLRELSQRSRVHTHLDVYVRTGSCFIANEGVNACVVARACPCACVCTLAPGARPPVHARACARQWRTHVRLQASFSFRRASVMGCGRCLWKLDASAHECP
jgi:hypothetical protein